MWCVYFGDLLYTLKVPIYFNNAVEQKSWLKIFHMLPHLLIKLLTWVAVYKFNLFIFYLSFILPIFPKMLLCTTKVHGSKDDIPSCDDDKELKFVSVCSFQVS